MNVWLWVVFYIFGVFCIGSIAYHSEPASTTEDDRIGGAVISGLFWPIVLIALPAILLGRWISHRLGLVRR